MNPLKKFEDYLVYKEYNRLKKEGKAELFKPNAQSMRTIRWGLRIMYFFGPLSAYLVYQNNPLAVFTIWLFIQGFFWKSGVEGKMDNAYPYLEHTDAMGLAFLTMITFGIAIIAFFIWI
jgi:hypothetical protein